MDNQTPENNEINRGKIMSNELKNALRPTWQELVSLSKTFEGSSLEIESAIQEMRALLGTSSTHEDSKE